MSSTLFSPYADLGKGGDYPIEANYGIRVYTPKEEIPGIGEVAGTLKGGLRTNFIGNVPILDGNKDIVGMAQVLLVVTAKPKDMPSQFLQMCGFETPADAVEYVNNMHREEFERDGNITIFIYRVIELY